MFPRYYTLIPFTGDRYKPLYQVKGKKWVTIDLV